MAELDLSIILKARDEASKVFEDVNSTASDTSGVLGVAKGAMVAFGAAVATATVAVGAFALKSFNDFTELGDTLSKMSLKTGVAVESLSALKYAGDLSNVSIDQLQGAFNKMIMTTANAKEGNDALVGTFKNLGLSVDELKTNTPEQTFLQIASGIASIEDPMIRADTAMQVFGKSGTELLPLLTSDIGQAMDEAKKLGLVMTTDSAMASEQFNDNITRVQSAVSGFGMAIANELLPQLAPLAEGLAQNAIKVMELFQALGGIDGIREKIVSSVTAMIKKFDEKTLIIMHLKAVWADIVKYFNEQVKPTIDKLLEAIKPYVPLIQFLAEVVGTVLVAAFHVFIAIVKTVVMKLLTDLKFAIEVVTTVLKAGADAWQWLVDKFKTVIEWGQKVVAIYEAIVNAVRRANEAMRNAVSGAVGAVQGVGTSIMNAVPFAEGGIVTRPTLAMIGEAGESEAVIPLSKFGSLFGGMQTAGATNVVNVTIEGGYYLSEDVADDLGKRIAQRMQGKFIL